MKRRCEDVDAEKQEIAVRIGQAEMAAQ